MCKWTRSFRLDLVALITCIFMGSVLTWHMYWPRSSILTPLITRVQVLKSLCVTDSRSLFVITCSCMARIALASALIQATYGTTTNSHQNQPPGGRGTTARGQGEIDSCYL